MKSLVVALAILLFAALANAQTEPDQMETLDYETAYVDVGQGDAIVLIHGLGADMSRFAGNIGPLSRTHRVITLDLVGFGASGKPDRAYRAQDFVDQVLSVMNQLGVDQATLVGNSMGGWVSMLFAEQHPERVKGLVLVAPAFVYGLPEAVSAEQLIAGAGPQTIENMRGYLERVYYDPPTDAATVERLLNEHKALNDGGAIPSISRSIKRGEDTFSPGRVEDIQTETLIVHGRQDGIVPLAASQALSTALPNATLTIIEQSGHWPQLEQSAAFNSLLVDWMRKRTEPQP